MPIFASYLLKNYLKVFFLAVFSFIAILLVTRLEEIAQFAAMGAKYSYLARFILYQTPYILPIAIPLSCLISAMLLFQRLSHTRELTALQAGGFPLWLTLAPLLIMASFISLANFYIVSEMATASHMATRKMVHDLTSINPLLLLQNAKIAKLQGAYVQMEPIKNGESASNLLIALNNQSSSRMTLFLAKKVKMKDNSLYGNDVALISSVATPNPASFDHLIVENQKTTFSSAAEFAGLLRRQGWKVANDHLTFSQLRIRKQKLAHDKENTRLFEKGRSEVVRRLALGIAAFTFTLMGAAFGMEISRHHKKRGLIWVAALTTATLIAFFVGKGLGHLFWPATALFLLPHVIILAASLRTLRRIVRGIE